MEPQYRIVFSGEIREGLSPTKVRANVAERLSVGAKQIERIFSGKPVVLKNGVSELAGIAYGERLNKLGMIVSMEPMPGSTPPAAMEPPHAEAQEPALSPASTPFPPLDPEPQAEPEPVAAAPEEPPAAIASPVTRPNPKKPLHSNADETWLSSSSFANLARTHLNLARAEALLNNSEYTGTIPDANEARPWPDLETDSEPTEEQAPAVEILIEASSAPVAAPAEAAEPEAAEPAPEPVQTSLPVPVESVQTLSGTFACSHCGTVHQLQTLIQAVPSAS